jgi:putative tricarboxylic transport membrane protein
MTTMLTLGIPGDAPSAVLIGALLIHGVQPGPLLFRDRGDFVFTIIFIMVLAGLLVALAGLAGAKPLALTLRIPNPWLWAGILVFAIVGSYALNNSVTDVWVMFSAGLFGFLCRKVNIPLGPLVLGLILGPMMESNLRRALILSRGDWIVVLSRPIVLFFLLATLLSLFWPVLRTAASRFKDKFEAKIPPRGR